MKMFSTVNHQSRIELGLSFIEYIFLEIISERILYEKDFPEIAKFLGIKKKKFFKMVEKLAERGLYEEYTDGRIYPSSTFNYSHRGL